MISVASVTVAPRPLFTCTRWAVYEARGYQLYRQPFAAIFSCRYRPGRLHSIATGAWQVESLEFGTGTRLSL